MLQVVESFDDEMRARVLQFVTGSSRVPLEGFKALQGTIHRHIIIYIYVQVYM